MEISISIKSPFRMKSSTPSFLLFAKVASDHWLHNKHLFLSFDLHQSIKLSNIVCKVQWNFASTASRSQWRASSIGRYNLDCWWNYHSHQGGAFLQVVYCCLVSVVMVNNAKQIKQNDFHRCTSLWFIRLSKTLEYIDYGAVLDCWSLKALFLPLTLKLSEGWDSFACSPLRV